MQLKTIKIITTALGIIQVFVAVMALPAGISMLLDPSGQDIGIPVEHLKASPFSDFFIPALFLFAGNGLGHLLGAVLSFKRSKSARGIGIGLGVYLLIWIIIQVYYTGIIHFLQPLFFGIAILEIALAVFIPKD